MALDDYDEMVGLVSSGVFEEPDDSDQWHVELTFNHTPDATALESIASGLGLAPLVWQVQKVENRSWLEEVAKSFPPLTIGPYHIIGSHIRETTPKDQIRLKIDAGLAFGSGEHGTTTGCLLSLEALIQAHDFTNIIDLGSGSGILAIAAAKRLNRSVLATDFDAVAVRVCNENARLNDVAEHVHCLQADGTDHPDIQRHGPYDLIFANILANTLHDMAEGISEITAPGGIIILSGLLQTQRDAIQERYAAHGFQIAREDPIAPWMTLSMQKA